ncbi:MAG: Complex I intermediate-associated protein 30 (CIA30) [Phormidesmis priestleyi Ana]|uniref:Complex I intermediate-associated protein 30 (CIA30) n=1 Tax=Phormidesmis priestleyi Ana TaxID=1666911 RepID=A0A0P8DFD7_9CYAN|nr:MAG: Complex I intermediate-associated protein 30 (CIA30) [Phormidesmis priestleyi Ana]
MAEQGDSKWNIGRLLSTLNYFGEVPFIGSFRWMQQLLGQSSTSPGITLNAKQKKILLIGANCSELSDRLQAKFPTVDWLLYDVCHQAQQSESMDTLGPNTLGSNTTVSQQSASVSAELNTIDKISVTQLKALLRSVDLLVLLNTSEVLNRVADEAAHYLTNASATHPPADSAQNLSPNADFVLQSVFDFSRGNGDLSAWGVLDDVVMGGVSQGRFFKGDQAAVFAGNVSTSNSGGFSSVRTRNFEPPFNFSGWSGLRLRLKGDGQRYKFIARNSEGWDSPAYIYGIDTAENTWIEVNVPFAEMVPTFRARSVPDAPAFDPAKVFSFQLMLSKFEYDRRLNPKFSAGSFELAVSDISVYRPRSGSALMIVNENEMDTIEDKVEAVLRAIA